MSDFTFLTNEQVWGFNRIDVISKRGAEAAISDFSILLGGLVSNYHIDSDRSLKGRTGNYWTKSNSEYDCACKVCTDGSIDYNYVFERIEGARPALPLSSIGSIPTNGESGKKARDGVLEVEYGYYPQQAVPRDMQERLEQAYRSSSISKTWNSYTTDSVAWDDYNTAFQPQTHQEYEYNGKRYVRIEANSFFLKGGPFTLSNGEQYRNGDSVWVEVEPVKWLVDEREKMMITEKIIFAGVQFNNERNYTGNFDRTDIKTFMDRYLSRELVQSRGIGQQSQTMATSTTTRNENPYNLEFDEVGEQDIIKSAIESNVSVFLHGKPGCGKSDRVKQLDPDFIELNLSHLDPELLDGLAGEKDGKAVHIKPPWLEELEEKCGEEPDKIHILFLEELTNASQMMQAKAYGIALDKKVAGRWKLPENARVVAAGNELEDSLVANEIAEPLYDRFAHVKIETTAESWLEWAVTPENTYERLDYKKDKEPRQKIHPAIYSYISCRGEKALRTPYNREHPQPHADPRRWKMASDMLYASNNPTTLRAIVGEELTRDFTAFCKRATLSIQDVINENYKEEDIVAMDMDEQLATLAGLVPVDERDMTKIRNFVKKLGPEMCGKFDAQWAGNNTERLEQIQEERMRENQINLKLHDGEEAKADVNYGILSAKKINAEYQMYLSKEENKGTETQEK